MPRRFDAAAAEGYGLTTAQIIYRMPDHLELFQEFIWQQFDTFPAFPVLGGFLSYWEEQIEGPIHSVTHGAKPTQERSPPIGEYRG